MRKRLATVMLALAAATTLAAHPASGASGSSVVGATVLSATTIDAAGCASFDPGRTDFGSITAGSTNVTTLDCDIKFGSSNDTAQLRLRQSDQLGGAMWMPTRGALDADFDGPLGGADGAFLEPIGAGSDQLWSTDVQADGRIVSAGRCNGAVNRDFCVARYEPDGSRDITFDGPAGGGNGEFMEPIGLSTDEARAITVQTDGRLVVAGSCTVAADSDFCLARYEADGSRDATLDGPLGGGDGEFIEPIGANEDYARSVVVQPDGRILAVGECSNGVDADFCLARYESNGSRDVTFDGPGGGSNGEFLESIGGGIDIAWDVALQPDGKIVVAGTCWNGADNDFCLARYELDGSRDASFDGPGGGGNGEFLEPIGTGNDEARSIAVQEDGRIVVVGGCMNAAQWDFCAARFEVDGSRDVSFDGPSGAGNGEFIEGLGPSHDYAWSVNVQADDKVVVTGECWSGSDTDFCVARYEPNGARDVDLDGPSGAGDGEVLIPVGADDDYAYASAIQSDGRLLLAGHCTNGVDHDFCLSSLDQGGNVSDYVTGGGSDTDWSSGAATSMFASCLNSVSGGASAQWTPNAGCPAVDGAGWNDVPTTYEKVAYTTALEPDPPDATASLRFGLRTASSQPAGNYLAPITFDVLAPNT